MAENTIEVEYYRLWLGGTWDTYFIDIPADTPEDQYDAAILAAAKLIDWRDGPPMIVGHYSGPHDEEEEDEETTEGGDPSGSSDQPEVPA